jgi:hypothetical protein
MPGIIGKHNVKASILNIVNVLCRCEHIHTGRDVRCINNADGTINLLEGAGILAVCFIPPTNTAKKYACIE